MVSETLSDPRNIGNNILCAASKAQWIIGVDLSQLLTDFEKRFHLLVGLLFV